MKKLYFSLVLVLGLVAIPLAQTMVTFEGFDLSFPNPGVWTAGGFQLNATGENGQAIGFLRLPAGSGTKTLSAAGGGSIVVWTGSATWATASSELRLGVEDVTAAGIGDTTQDVVGIKIAGTNAITAPNLTNWVMTTGSKTMSHGDNIAITARMPLRAGVDSVTFGTWINSPNNSTGRPYGAANSAKTSEMLYAVIRFDDGTYGWVDGSAGITSALLSFTIGNASSPDEYAGTFTVSTPTQISRLGWPIDDAAAADDYDLILYADPYGSPSAVRTAVIDSAAQTNEGSTTVFVWGNIPPVTLMPGTTYAIAARPSTANTIVLYYTTLGTGFDGLKITIPFVSNVKLAGRTNQTGPFVETAAYHVPYFGMTVNGFAAGGGASSFTF